MRDFRLRRGVASLAAVILALGLAGCSDDGGDDGGSGGDGTAQDTPLFPDDFKGVCQGATVSAATAYDEAAASHKALYFAAYEDDLTDRSANLPPDWTVLFEAEGNALEAIDLVLCAERTAEVLVQECTGYEDDGEDTGNTVIWHTATYEVSVRAATTGQVLAQETMEATDEECPTFVFFDEEGDTEEMYAEVPEDDLIEYFKPFVQP